MQRIAIIGGGAAGAAVVGEFLRRGSRDHQALTWFVGPHAPGRGVAYGTGNKQHLLNVRAANMGLFADDAGALLRFAKSRGIAAEAADFLARGVFGDYVEATLARLKAVHASGISIDVRSTQAVALHARDGGFDVLSEDGATLAVDSVVLAVGAPPSQPLNLIDASALSSGRYLTDPWSVPNLAQAPQRVIVIGTGLTAVDAILSAAEQWPEAKIVALSRHGRLPGAHRHRPSEAYGCQRDLIDSMRAQPEVRRWLRLLREALSEAADWRSVIDGLRPATTELWRSLDPVQRGRFLRHTRWLWEVARHRMAPQAAEAIELLRDAGRLDVVAGRVCGVEGSSPLTLTLRRRDDGGSETLAADLVIQATGFESLSARTPHRLLRQMIETGLVRIDPFGLGLEADAGGRLLKADGAAVQGIYAVGTLLRGALWECTALPEIRTAAAILVRELQKTTHADAGSTAKPVSSRNCTAQHIDMAFHQFGA